MPGRAQRTGRRQRKKSQRRLLFTSMPFFSLLAIVLVLTQTRIAMQVVSAFSSLLGRRTRIRERRAFRLLFQSRQQMATKATPDHLQSSAQSYESVSSADNSQSSRQQQQRLDYHHGYHAGNFADTFKHTILVLVLQHILEKAKPLSYVETHSGAGLYALHRSQMEARNDPALEVPMQEEYERGVGNLLKHISSNRDLSQKALPKSIATYLEVVESFQEEQEVVDELLYPGSPLFAASLLQSHACNNTNVQHHSLLLYEKADSQLQQLRQHMTTRRCNRLSIDLRNDNGYAGLAQYAQTTGSTNRALVVIDPPYQYGSDTEKIVALCSTLQYHWRSARIAIWHPVRQDHADKLERLYKLLRNVVPATVDILAVEVYAPPALSNRKEDVGTGMILIQPPFGIKEELEKVLPELYNLLCPCAFVDGDDTQKQLDVSCIQIKCL